MKKTSLVLAAFALIAMLFVGCSAESYLNDTVWTCQMSAEGYTYTWTFSFSKGGTGSYIQVTSDGTNTVTDNSDITWSVEDTNVTVAIDEETIDLVLDTDAKTLTYTYEGETMVFTKVE
ncbi:MAG: hypothetical protein K5839_08130 [Treponemataceae bacterium]|nr:hypothetical protein [Treponemataceae bacterium]